MGDKRDFTRSTRKSPEQSWVPASEVCPPSHRGGGASAGEPCSALPEGVENQPMKGKASSMLTGKVGGRRLGLLAPRPSTQQVAKGPGVWRGDAENVPKAGELPPCACANRCYRQWVVKRGGGRMKRPVQAPARAPSPRVQLVSWGWARPPACGLGCWALDPATCSPQSSVPCW